MVKPVARKTDDLQWDAPAVAKFMSDNGIQDRSDLVRALDGVGQTTVYRVFDERWGGAVKLRMLTAMSARFNIPLSHLVGLIVVDSTREAVSA
jgi:hypothetical protein